MRAVGDEAEHISIPRRMHDLVEERPDEVVWRFVATDGAGVDLHLAGARPAVRASWPARWPSGASAWATGWASG